MWSYTEEENDFLSGTSSPKDHVEEKKERPQGFMKTLECFLGRKDKYTQNMWDRYSI